MGHFITFCRYSRLAYSLSTTFLNVGGGRVGHAPSLGYDLLDGGISRLHTNFQISATLSKKVLIFLANLEILSLY